MSHEFIITQLLLDLGVARNCGGFRLCIEAVKLYLENEDYVFSPMKNLYAALAKQFNLSEDSVRGRFRTLVKRVWSMNSDGLSLIAGVTLEECPSSSDFLELIYTYLMRSMSSSERY